MWRSGAVACAALADSLDERYGARSRRRIEIPNAMLQVMVDNLKAEAYQLRMRIVTRAASRGAPVERAAAGDHVEAWLAQSPSEPSVVGAGCVLCDASKPAHRSRGRAREWLHERMAIRDRE